MTSDPQSPLDVPAGQPHACDHRGPEPETLDPAVVAALTAGDAHDFLSLVAQGLAQRFAEVALSVCVRSQGQMSRVLDVRYRRGQLDAEGWGMRPDAEGRLTVRMEHAGRWLGVASVLVPARHPSGDEVALLTSTAQSLAAVVDHARLDVEWQQRLAIATAVRSLLLAGVRSVSVLEAAEAIARTVAQVLDVPISCTYLVDKFNRVTELASVGATQEQHIDLRRRLIGQLASESPVWKNSVEAATPGPYFLDDTSAPGSTRPGGGMAQTLGYRCLATIPLLSSDGPIGVVVCGDNRGPRRWPAGDYVVATELAMQATVLLDNARLREAEHHQAIHDSLTGLLNRDGLRDRLGEEIAHAGRTGERLAVLLLDLNRFKDVNDTLGHGQGDLLLAEVAARLRADQREDDVVARLGGDEFALVLRATGVEGASRAAARVEAELAEPVPLAGRLVQVAASIGIAVYPDHATNVTDLVRMADVAMYVAKRNALPYSVYSAMHDGLAVHGQLEQTTVLGELGRALSGEELVLHLQPKVDAHSGAVVGAEALVRWNHPQRGLLAPGEFVPLAERTGLIRRLTAWVVPQALGYCRRWLDLGLDLTVAVNASAHDMTDPDFVARVAAALVATGVAPDRLVMELTETALLLDVGAALRTLSGLRELGVHCSLDDFGTGYSALSYLSSLPIDELKIDRSFVSDGLDERSCSVISAMVTLGHDLGLNVVGEGVESLDMVPTLVELGCDQIQGFAFGRPQGFDDFLAWVQARSASRDLTVLT